jgi:hypothetical protein
MGNPDAAKNITGAATHAVVIGVGHYPHLPGGKSRNKFVNPSGMGQLKSPPESARAIARWLIEEYQHPTKPLASVELLLSDATSPEFKYKVNNKNEKFVTAPATMPKVQEAIAAWQARGNNNPDHLLLFFFCGHGISLLPDLALLIEDFGQNPLAPLDGAIDFRRFRQGMDECAAREQCYFVDACRVGSDLLIRNNGFAGRPVIQSTGDLNTSGRLRQAPVFYSTLAGAPAYAKPGEPSLFTTALLEGLAGAGCGDEQGPWQVRTNLLHDALNFIMRDASQRLAVPQVQINPSDDLSSIELTQRSVI